MNRARNLLTGAVLALSACAGVAYGQELSSTARATGTGITAEIKPLPTVLSLVPGVGSIQAGVEADINQTVAPFLEFTAVNANLPERLDAIVEDEAEGDDTIRPKKLQGGGVDIGARFYTAPLGHSWYGQAKIGYSEVTGEWEYREEIVDSRVASLTPGLGGGYRWLWNNGVVLRLGAGVSANLVQASDVDYDEETANTLEAQEDLEDRFDEPVLANVDLGLGYRF